MIVQIKKDRDFKKSDLVMPYSLFPYANLLFYGLNKKIFSLYRTGNCYFSKYDDSIQICSEEIKDDELMDIVSFAIKNIIRMITAKPEIALKLTDLLSKLGSSNKKEDGFIMEINVFSESISNNLNTATIKSEFRDIAHIVCLANSNHHHFYTESQLFEQYFKRSKSGYCRNFYVKDNRTIVGSISTYCETDEYCVIGGLAVLPEFQKRGIGKNLFLGLINQLRKEGKRIFLFCYNRKLFEFYSQFSCTQVKISKILID